MLAVIVPRYWLLQVARATTGTEVLRRLGEDTPLEKVWPQPATVRVVPAAGSLPAAGRVRKLMLPPALMGLDRRQTAMSLFQLTPSPAQPGWSRNCLTPTSMPPEANC